MPQAGMELRRWRTRTTFSRGGSFQQGGAANPARALRLQLWRPVRKDAGVGSCGLTSCLTFMPAASATDFAVRPLGRAWRSLVSVFGGWAVMVAYLLIQYGQDASVNPRWYGMPGMFGTYSLPYVGGVWLVVVLPLFCFVPHRARLWSWCVAVPLFGLIGFLVISWFFRFSYNHATNRIAGLAALVGAATGFFSAVWQSRLSKRAAELETTDHDSTS
jgi:hypothetical protein